MRAPGAIRGGGAPALKRQPPRPPPGAGRPATAAAEPRSLAWLVGLATVAAAHTAIVTAAWLAPDVTGTVSKGAESAHDVDDVRGCAAVVTPACLGERLVRSSPPPPAADDELPSTRRCPEPLRRMLRRDTEPAPPALVDLLEAELVERLGVADGKWAPPTPTPVAAATATPERIRKVEAIVAQNDRVASILKGDEEGHQRRSQLGKILGTATGRADGDGLVHRSGSAYVREVRVAMQQAFVLPGNVPPWLRSELRAKVIIRRMTATGQVLEHRVEKESGNEAFDDTVRALLRKYRSGVLQLPPPPPHVLEEINARGLIVELRGG